MELQPRNEVKIRTTAVHKRQSFFTDFCYSHTVEDRAFSRLVRRIPVDVVRNTARVSAIVRWSGKRHIYN